MSQEEDARNQLFQQKKKLEQECSGLKKDIEDLELSVQKIDQDKATKDHQIRNLNDEIAHQDELINKLNKEKKLQGENNQKTGEELQAAEDKINHLNKVKAKLEQTLDELEDSLEREKKLRGDVEKAKRKVCRRKMIQKKLVINGEIFSHCYLRFVLDCRLKVT